MSHFRNGALQGEAYSWGSAALAEFYREMGKASRQRCTSFASCSMLLEAWIYAYFPRFRHEFRGWKEGHPRCTIWRPSSCNSLQELQAYKTQLDNITVRKIDWTPYGARGRNELSLHQVSTYTGLIRNLGIMESHMPLCCLPHFGYVQGIPPAPIQPLEVYRGRDSRRYKLKFRWCELLNFNFAAYDGGACAT